MKDHAKKAKDDSDGYTGNLNKIALDEFCRAIRSSAELSETWKKSALGMIKNGIPENLDQIQELMEYEEDDSTQGTQREGV